MTPARLLSCVPLLVLLSLALALALTLALTANAASSSGTATTTTRATSDLLVTATKEDGASPASSDEASQAATTSDLLAATLTVPLPLPDSNPCLNGGILLTTSSSPSLSTSQPSSGRAIVVDDATIQCACLAGWAGEVCEYRDWCSVANPCQNGGRCMNLRDGVMCVCDEVDFLGARCEIASTCTQETCVAPHGKCVRVGDTMQQAAQAMLLLETGENSAVTTMTTARSKRPSSKGPASSSSSSSSASSSSSSAASEPRLFGGSTSISCVCADGWTGSDCSRKLQDVCAAIQPCSVFDLDLDAAAGGSSPASSASPSPSPLPSREPNCGCRAAVAAGCEWCLEEGQAFAPAKGTLAAAADGGHTDTCQSCVVELHHCPPAAAQAIRSCAAMDGTSFGWCASGNPQRGWAVDGNPSSPAAGAKRCHRWVWSAAGCKDDWTTGPPRKEPPTRAQCSAVPPCFDSSVAGSSLCGCQAAMSLGCEWCLEQQLAFPPLNASSAAASDSPSAARDSTCKSWAKHPPACPSQQAQTIHECAGVGGLPFGWCATDESEPLAGYATDGTPRAPTTTTGKKCLQWYFHSASCPSQYDETNLVERQTPSAAGDDDDDTGRQLAWVDFAALVIALASIMIVAMCYLGMCRKGRLQPGYEPVASTDDLVM